MSTQGLEHVRAAKKHNSQENALNGNKMYVCIGRWVRREWVGSMFVRARICEHACGVCMNVRVCINLLDYFM